MSAGKEKRVTEEEGRTKRFGFFVCLFVCLIGKLNMHCVAYDSYTLILHHILMRGGRLV